jgi:hypothetical protein
MVFQNLAKKIRKREEEELRAFKAVHIRTCFQDVPGAATPSFPINIHQEAHKSYAGSVASFPSLTHASSAASSPEIRPVLASPSHIPDLNIDASEPRQIQVESPTVEIDGLAPATTPVTSPPPINGSSLDTRFIQHLRRERARDRSRLICPLCKVGATFLDEDTFRHHVNLQHADEVDHHTAPADFSSWLESLHHRADIRGYAIFFPEFPYILLAN